MTDWATISSLATGGGTLILAIATFGSVRQAKRSTELTERALLSNLRPQLVSSHAEDPSQRIMFGDRHWVDIPGHGAVMEYGNGNVYLALGLRNVGTGLAVIHGWHVEVQTLSQGELPVPVEDFRRNTRDLYVPPGDTGFWQGAVRDEEDALHEPLRQAAERREPIGIYLLYGDWEGGQRTVTRFGVIPEEDGGLDVSVARNWNIDRDDPR